MVESRKRRREFTEKPKKLKSAKRFKKQVDYNSDSSNAESLAQSDNGGVALEVEEPENESIQSPPAPVTGEKGLPDASDSEATGASDLSDASDSNNSNPNLITKRKRNNPEAFATSISKILSSKLSSNKRADPVLSRSKSALEASQGLADFRLETKARKKLNEEHKSTLDRGRVRDVLGLETAADGKGAGVGESAHTISVGEIKELENRLRKTAQRGVVKLFNAVRAAQVKGEEARREAKKSGIIGTSRREEKINDMSKKGFLDTMAIGEKGAEI
ncbi:MAG: hypothetical protein M1829_003270 [Trizodia sp. TS-e1964]|nr:MAG: hypothetical protein M1829_003270 [Trizodia sp. TS-e1964]